MPKELAAFAQRYLPRVQTVFRTYLRAVTPVELRAAIEHSLISNGKMLRPLLVYAAGSVFAAKPENMDIPAAAVEMMHTYSLIHDDLPAMDNADLRRGKTSSHKAFGEAAAILAGDALQSLALEVLVSHAAPLTAARRAQMVKVLTHATGPYGMVAGQILDLGALLDANISDHLLLRVYQLKTGALLNACLELGRLSSSDDDEFNQRALQEFGEHLGLAFQIQDDILDIEGNTAKLGKKAGLDAVNAKKTYALLHGVAAAKAKVRHLNDQALTAIDYLGAKADPLRLLAKALTDRNT